MQTYIDIRNTDAMYNSLVAEIISKGHQVTIVASSENRENTNFRMEGEAKVLRVKTLPLLNVNPIIKGLANLLLSFQYSISMRKHLPRRTYDVIVTPTPPITLTSLVRKTKRKNSAKVLLILRDIFPQNAVDLGMMSKRSPIYSLFRKMEKSLYSCADIIGCMTRGNIEYLISHNPKINSKKLVILPNWTTITERISKPSADIITSLGLKNKFIVIFGGNLGIAQRVENIIDFARIHSAKKDLLILIIGKGTHKNHLLKLIEKNELSNIKHVDFMHRSDYESVVSISKVGLISLHENFTIPNIPSRTLSYYNFRLPVFAIVDSSTDYGEMLKEDLSGYCCTHGDRENYKVLFDHLYFDAELRRKMGENGYGALQKKYNPESTYKIIESSLFKYS